MLFPHIRVSVVRYDNVRPYGTAIGCSSVVTVRGAGFRGLLPVDELRPDALTGDVNASGASHPLLTCGFGELGLTAAMIVDDTTLSCATPVPTAAGTVEMRVDLGTLTRSHGSVNSAFGVFDQSAIHLHTLMPSGGAYNLEPNVSLTGIFEDWGDPRCRFYEWTGSRGLVINTTHAICSKPRFPDAMRDEVGTYQVSFSPNGQCFHDTATRLRSLQSGTRLRSLQSGNTANFRTYNSQVNSISVWGAPSSSSVNVLVAGEGFVFPGLAGALCRFTNTISREYVSTALSTISTTMVQCSAPSTASIGVWTLQVGLHNSALSLNATSLAWLYFLRVD